MIKDYKSIVGAKVLGFDTGELLAIVSGIIVDPDTGMVEAFWVKPVSIPLKNAILRVADIQAFKKNIYVRSDQVLADVEDVIRIREILEDQRRFIGSWVQNEAGDSYGRCVSLTFDTKTFALKQIQSRRSILGFFVLDERLFSYDNIVRVLPGLVLVRDDATKKEPLIATTPEAAAG